MQAGYHAPAPRCCATAEHAFEPFVDCGGLHCGAARPVCEHTRSSTPPPADCTGTAARLQSPNHGVADNARASPKAVDMQLI
jgi:hypothetical protein